ncbi:MAG: hypothetical protein ACOYLS_09055 [Polymorphobacter sp.]
MDDSLPARRRGLAALRRWLASPTGKRVQQAISIGLSAIILVILFRAVAAIGWRQIIAVVPTGPLFWLLFLGSYLLQPLTDWLIYRPWWGLDWRANAIFLKKRVMNEALFSYSGDTYLMVRATGILGLPFDPAAPTAQLQGRGDGPGVDPRTHPLAAVKDVAITSGLAGNLTTLLMLVLALALGGDAVLDASIDPDVLRRIVIGFAIIVALSVAILFFRGKVMSLSVRNNLRAFWWHLFRVLTAHALIVATWVVALPAIPVSTWVLLGALRMVIGRMPLPSKELLFAAITVSLAGPASVAVAALMAAQGALYLLCHVLAWFAATAIEASGPGR